METFEIQRTEWNILERIKFLVWSIICILCSVFSATGQKSKSKADFFNDKATLIPVFAAGIGIVSEGPAMSPDGLLYFADVSLEKNTGVIRCYNPENGKTTIFRSSSNGAGGLAFDSDGNLLVAEGALFGGRRITKTDWKTGVSSIVTDSFNGKPYNAPNDLTIDNKGRIFFTDSRYLGDESIELPFMGIYRIDLDGSVHLVAANASRPNGIAISPNQQRLYVANYDYPSPGIYGALPKGFTGPTPNATGDILVYWVLPDGNLRFEKKIAHFEGGGPDGLKVDKEENIYVIESNQLYIYSSEGDKLAEMKIPIENGFAANLCFGTGKFSKTLFITATHTLYMITTKKEGFRIEQTSAK
jgi:gluconolactonase